MGFCPLFYKWFHAACAHLVEFASTWLAKKWIQGSLLLVMPCGKWPTTFYPAPFRSQHAANLVKLLFLTVDWRVHLDIIFATLCSNPNATLSKRFVCCLECGNLRAFSEPNSHNGSCILAPHWRTDEGLSSQHPIVSCDPGSGILCLSR
jgi:hypothetical protein